MRNVIRRRILATFAAGALLLVGSAAMNLAAAQGTLAGTVTVQGTSAPLQDARVIIVGTSLSTTTGPDGKYQIARMPVGAAEVRIIRVGYQEQKKAITVVQGQTLAVDFVMVPSVVQLQEVVTTAAGEQRRVEVGNAVANVDVGKLAETAPIRNLSDVLNGRVPGVMVEGGGQTGSGQRIRIRGVSSVSLSNDPIYIIDGIEIVKGPSAATLYGTDAANGVIVITTKKGRAGTARWSGFAEGGILDDRHHYSDNYTLAGHTPAGAPLILSGQCPLPSVSAGKCIEDSLRTYNPITDPNATPLSYGNRNAVGLQLNGGTDAIRYFLSAGRDNEVGVFKLPEFEQAAFDSAGTSPHPWQVRPNSRLMNSFRANISADVSPTFDATVNFGYTTVDQLTS